MNALIINDKNNWLFVELYENIKWFIDKWFRDIDTVNENKLNRMRLRVSSAVSTAPNQAEMLIIRSNDSWHKANDACDTYNI